MGEAPRSRLPPYSIAAFLDPASDPEVHKQYPDDKPLPYDMAQKTEQYFFLYFAMTGMHALHMVIGCGILIFHDRPRQGRGLHRRACDVC